MKKKATIEPEKAVLQIVPEKSALPEFKEKVPKFKISGHSVDQKLAYKQPSRLQTNIFDTLSPVIKNEIRKDLKEEVAVQGIGLTISEDRLLNAILKMLWEKSTKDKYGNLIKAGNKDPHKNSYGDETTDFPTLAFTAAELYKEYTCRDDYAGSEAQHIKETIFNLEQKKFLIIYKRKFSRSNAKGEIEHIEQRIEEYLPLLRVKSFYELTPEEALRIDSGDKTLKEEKAQVIIVLNPIFIDQIDTKFIEYPNDINKRTAIAAGGHMRVTPAINTLRDYLLRSISANRGKDVCQAEINLDKLPFLLGLDKYIKQRKRKKMEEIIEKAIETVIKLEIALTYVRVTGSMGQDKIIFDLNLDY